ncbi:MAG: hypothetical protein ABWY03_00090 [Microbacterium sp.]
MDDFTRALNVTVTIVVTVIAVCVIVAMSGKVSAQARADRFSLRVRLPYGSEETRESVTRALRARTIASGYAILAGAALSGILLFTPLATSPFFIFYTLLTGLVIGSVVGTTVVSVRERLFHPAPDAPRVARARTMRVADYLDPARRLLPWLLAGAALVGVILIGVFATRTPDRVDGVAGTAAAVFAVVAAAVFVALPLLERVILERPQPASDTLELAWDDALRVGTIMSLRLSASIAAWFVVSLSIAALWTNGDALSNAWAMQLPTWGLIALQFVYPNTGRVLPVQLYPDWLRRPATAAGAA